MLATVVVLAVLYFTGVFGGGDKKININLKKGQIERLAPQSTPAIRFV